MTARKGTPSSLQMWSACAGVLALQPWPSILDDGSGLVSVPSLHLRQYEYLTISNIGLLASFDGGYIHQGCWSWELLLVIAIIILPVQQ